MASILEKLIEISDYDFETAKAMYKSKRYLYVAFMDETKIKIEKYIDTLRKELNIELIIIFGSILTKRFSNESDIDILIVATEFSKMNKMEAYKIVSKPIWELKLNIDPITATTEEIKNYKKASFISEILKTGRIIYKKTA